MFLINRGKPVVYHDTNTKQKTKTNGAFVTKQQYRMLHMINWLSISCVTFYLIDMFYNPDYFGVETRYTTRVLNNLVRKKLVKIVYTDYNGRPFPYYFMTKQGKRVLASKN